MALKECSDLIKILSLSCLSINLNKELFCLTLQTKIIHVVGARPQFIKYLTVSRAIEAFNKESECIIDILVHTGQHYDYEMSDVFFEEFGMRNPDYSLNVGSSTHGKQTAQIIQEVEEVLLKEKPEAVMVYGDTNSTLGGALAAAKIHIPVAHVEAGLRSFNKHMPEELNRLLTDHSSTILFCPSNVAIENLANEGFGNIYNNGVLVSPDCISGVNNVSSFKASKSNPFVINVGDVMYDVLLNSVEIADKKSNILNELQLTEKEYYLLTLHRAENTDREEVFEQIVMFVNKVSKGKTVIFPMHPRTRKTYGNVAVKFNDSVKIVEPQGYYDMIELLRNCLKIMTDSGGMQKEAFWLKVPCITLREQTEWVETVLSGWNILYEDYEGSHKPLNKYELCYGDGKAADRITNLVCKMVK